MKLLVLCLIGLLWLLWILGMEIFFVFGFGRLFVGYCGVCLLCVW